MIANRHILVWTYSQFQILTFIYVSLVFPLIFVWQELGYIHTCWSLSAHTAANFQMARSTEIASSIFLPHVQTSWNWLWFPLKLAFRAFSPSIYAFTKNRIQVLYIREQHLKYSNKCDILCLCEEVWGQRLVQWVVMELHCICMFYIIIWAIFTTARFFSVSLAFMYCWGIKCDTVC